MLVHPELGVVSEKQLGMKTVIRCAANDNRMRRYRVAAFRWRPGVSEELGDAFRTGRRSPESPSRIRRSELKNGIVGFGLVGTGMAGGFHARELSFVDGAKLVAVCSRNEENVRRFADEYGVQRWTTDYRHLFDYFAVDVVCVLTHRLP